LILYLIEVEPAVRREMQSGMVRLEPIYEFVRQYAQQHPNDYGAYQINGKIKSGRDYLEKCDTALLEVPNEQGFYLWGFYNNSKFWINVYLGKAGKGKTAHLRDRLYKELTAERASLWREVNLNDAKLLSIGQKVHPTMWDKYKPHWERALHKAGSTHIFWVSAPKSELDPQNIEAVENDLIEAMNPTGNRQRRMPSATLQQDAGKIFGAFRAMIHLEQNRKTQLELTYHKDFWKWVGTIKPSTA
jgi:hypothetical protein